MEGILKGQKIPNFEGKKEKFPQWSYTFLSICLIAGCKEVLTDDNYAVPKSSDVLDPATDADKIAARKANAMAYALLTITVRDQTGFQAIRNGKNADLPEGSARLAWKNLLRIYQPKSTTQKFELEQRFNDCKLEKETKNPDEWFTELEHIRTLLQEDHSYNIDDERMIQHIIYNIKPKAYDTLVFALKRDLQYINVNTTNPPTAAGAVATTTNKLDLDRIKDEIRQVYGQINKGKTQETALSAGKTKKKFKGDCRICGAKGHKAADCWDNDKNKDKRPSWYKNPEERKKKAETANNVSSNSNNVSPNTANATTEKPKLFCNYCKKDNHTEDRCFKKLKDLSEKPGNNGNSASATANVMLLCYDSCMLTTDEASNVTPNTFVADSGASAHMVHSKYLLSNFKEDLGTVKIGDNTEVKSLGTGTFKGYHINKDGQEIEVTLQDVLLVPDLWVNLFSITKATSINHCKVICEDNLITVNTHSEPIHFTKVLPHGAGKIMATEFFTNSECANLALKKTTYHDLHKKLGHPHKQSVVKTAKFYGIKLHANDQDPVCEDCAISKIRVKNFGHNNDNKAVSKGERISIDISSVQQVSYGGAKFWLLIQDEYTDYIWSYFLSAKSELATTFITWVKNFQKDHGVQVKYLRCDNSGENQALQQELEQDNELNITMEFTAPYTPQQNGSIERKFATLWGKVRSMLNGAKLPWSLRNKLWAQCANLATQLENILVSPESETTPFELLHGIKHPDWLDNLHTFGEIAIVHDGAHAHIRAKLQNKGLAAMFVGYPANHAGEVCQFLNLQTKKLISSRTAIFLHKNYGDYYKMAKEAISFIPENGNVTEELSVEPVINYMETTEEEAPDNFFQNLIEDLPEDPDEPPNISNRGLRELRNLQTFYNPDPLQYLPDNEQLQHAAVLTTYNPIETALQATIYDGNPDPKTFQEAQVSSDWPNWWGAMCTELQNMHDKQVWTITRRSSIPTSRKIIGNRWVYVLKDDGRFRARTVAKGFTQIPGKDFQENHSPVVNDTTFHTILVLKILLQLEAGQFDIETAFLYGDLEEKLWMDLPEGYIKFIQEKIEKGQANDVPVSEGILVQDLNEKDFCCELKKAIYGLVQAARQWWKKFKTVIQNMGYKQSKADPCLFIKEGTTKSFIIIYVDDGGIFSTEENIKEVIKELGKTFNVKYLGKLENFIGCKLIENNAKDTIWIHQPKLLKHLKQSFGKLVENVREYKTPAAPKTTIMRPQPGDPLISPEKQKLFRSGVGMLLYLVKHSRPDISNAVRELSKVADGATEAHWKELLRTIKFVLSTPNKALKLKPKKKGILFHMEGKSDTSYAEDKDDRFSVYGYTLYFCDAPIATKSKMGRSVTLSSTEAEYFAVSEVAKEILFVKQLLESCGINIELPIIIRVDNVGAIFLGNNFSVSQRTKHIDIRAHFVREYIEDDVLKLLFIRSEDNDADIFTKNTSEELFNKHSSKFVEEIETT
jgi:Reverse transcriptase (RNA-dependent DNA polymerase)/gag-polypeptide of LTR copia-type